MRSFSRLHSLFFVLGLGVVVASLIFVRTEAATVSELRAQLLQELKVLENQIQDQEHSLEDLRNQKESLQRDIAILDQEIKKIKLELTYRQLAIKKLTGQIDDRTVRIGELEERLQNLRVIMAEQLRTIYVTTQRPLLYAFLGSPQLSGFFSEVYALESTQGKLQLTAQDVRDTKFSLEEEKSGLENERSEEEELRIIQENQRKGLLGKEKEKQESLKSWF